MMSQLNQPLTVASFYSFSRIDGLKTKQAELLTLCNALRLRGTLLLAEEGVNGTISGRQDQVKEFRVTCYLWIVLLTSIMSTIGV